MRSTSARRKSCPAANAFSGVSTCPKSTTSTPGLATRWATSSTYPRKRASRPSNCDQYASRPIPKMPTFSELCAALAVIDRRIALRHRRDEETICRCLKGASLNFRRLGVLHCEKPFQRSLVRFLPQQVILIYARCASAEAEAILERCPTGFSVQNTVIASDCVLTQ